MTNAATIETRETATTDSACPQCRGTGYHRDLWMAPSDEVWDIDGPMTCSLCHGTGSFDGVASCQLCPEIVEYAFDDPKLGVMKGQLVELEDGTVAHAHHEQAMDEAELRAYVP